MVARVRRFLDKTLAQRALALRFAGRRLLAAVPWLPVPQYVRREDGGRQWFWWSRLPPWFDPELGTLEHGGPDVAELRFLCRVMRPGMCFVDVGAYHGLYAVVAGRAMDGRGSLVLFEPSARARRRIAVHLRLNRLTGTVERYAVAGAGGQRDFYEVVAGYETMSALTPPPVADPVRRVSVAATTLDDYCASRGLTRIDVLKIDVEGGELELFAGAGWVLDVVRPVIIAEVLDWVTRPRGYEAREILSFLAGRGYAWFDFTPAGGLRAHCPQPDYPHVRNYLAVPREKLGAVGALIEPTLRQVVGA